MVRLRDCVMYSVLCTYVWGCGVKRRWGPMCATPAARHTSCRALTCALVLPQSALFDFPSLLTVVLLLCCTCAYIRERTAWLQQNKRGALGGVLYKLSVVGRRLSEAVAVGLVVMAVHLLFVR